MQLYGHAPESALDPDLLKRVFGAFPSGVVAVAAHVEGELVGLAASSFTSISLDPPLVSVSVSKSSATWPRLRAAGRLGVSVLADRHDTVCRRLAGPAHERFDGLSVDVTDAGAVLVDEALATFQCSVHREVEAGDHVIVLLRLHEVAEGATALPLVFHRSGFARLDIADLDPARLAGRINGEPVPVGE